MAGRRLHRLLKDLRASRISVRELHDLHSLGSGPIVVDARPFDVQQRLGRIPGAISLDPAAAVPVACPACLGSEIVVHGDCADEVSVALLAQRLREHGVRKARPLAGGFDAWVAAGYALEH